MNYTLGPHLSKLTDHDALSSSEFAINSCPCEMVCCGVPRVARGDVTHSGPSDLPNELGSSGAGDVESLVIVHDGAGHPACRALHDLMPEKGVPGVAGWRARRAVREGRGAVVQGAVGDGTGCVTRRPPYAHQLE